MKGRKSKVGRIINVALVALVVYVAASLLVLQVDIATYRKQLNTLEDQCREQTVLNQEMVALIERGSDSDYIIKMAREKLGLIFPDEKVFYNASGNQ